MAASTNLPEVISCVARSKKNASGTVILKVLTNSCTSSVRIVGRTCIASFCKEACHPEGTLSYRGNVVSSSELRQKSSDRLIARGTSYLREQALISARVKLQTGFSFPAT